MAPRNPAADTPPAGVWQIRAITSAHEGSWYEVTVGSPRKVYKRKTFPRGGYIKDAVGTSAS